MPTRIFEITTKFSWLTFIESACDLIAKSNKTCHLYTEISDLTNRIKFKCYNDRKSIEYISENPLEVYLFLRFILHLQPHMHGVVIDTPFNI